MGGKMKGLFSSPKPNHQKGEMNPNVNKGKNESQTRNRDINVFVVWE